MNILREHNCHYTVGFQATIGPIKQHIALSFLLWEGWVGGSSSQVLSVIEQYNTNYIIEYQVYHTLYPIY